MSTAVANLLEKALLLSSDSRVELVEAILEKSSPSEDFLKRQVSVVAQRMQNVAEGVSSLIPAEEAHRQVLASLSTRK